MLPDEPGNPENTVRQSSRQPFSTSILICDSIRAIMSSAVLTLMLTFLCLSGKTGLDGFGRLPGVELGPQPPDDRVCRAAGIDLPGGTHGDEDRLIHIAGTHAARHGSVEYPHETRRPSFMTTCRPHWAATWGS